MKKIMIISDTHKNQVLLRKAFSMERNVTHIFHLGDDYNDLDTNLDLIADKDIYKVPGIYHPVYRNGSIEPTLTVTINNWNFLLIHALEDLNKNRNNADVILYGHTHHADFRNIEGQYFINPGHLKAETDRNRKASYLIAELNDHKLNLCFKYLDGNIFLEETIVK